jgi:hypothetical protein
MTDDQLPAVLPSGALAPASSGDTLAGLWPFFRLAGVGAHHKVGARLTS